ncbi:MAG: protein kinase [Pseudomonadales bacterium]|nr:protein kinase [Pseudomonadales bacterium]
MNIAWANSTTKGLKPQNEDAVGGVVPTPWLQQTKGLAFVISDGVSTAEAGKEASEICVNDFLSEYYKTPDAWPIKTSAHRTLMLLNRLLFGKNGKFQNAEQGYVATLSSIILTSQQAYLFHIGDSRIYRVRDHHLEQLTRDHQVDHAGNDSCLERAMGVDASLPVDFKSIDIQLGDLFLMTTDGVHDFIDSETMLATVDSINQDSQQICDALIEKALANGSNDNLSCQLITVKDLSQDQQVLAESVESLLLPPLLKRGMEFDGFKINAKLHSSAQNNAYLVTDVKTGEQMIMKTPSEKYDGDDKEYDRFMWEEWVGSRIDHPNVVNIKKIQRSKKYLYYLMEVLTGETLDRWMERHPVPSGGQMIKLVNQVIAGVHAFHEKGMVFCNINPSNIIVAADGGVKLVDFSSVFVGGITEKEQANEHGKLLDANYTDPEVRKGQLPRVQSDIFSIATLAYEMLTQELPFGHKLSKCESLGSFAKLRYNHSFLHNQEIPVWFDGALRSALELNPAKRYNSLTAFQQELTNPNPYFLSEEYLRILEASLPTVPFWKVLATLWVGSLIVGVLIFVV